MCVRVYIHMYIHVMYLCVYLYVCLGYMCSNVDDMERLISM